MFENKSDPFVCHSLCLSEVNKSELARRFNVDVKEVRRMLNPHHGTKLPTIGTSVRSPWQAYRGTYYVIRIR